MARLYAEERESCYRLSAAKAHFGSGLGPRAIGRELGMSHGTVREYPARIAAANITLPPSSFPKPTSIGLRLGEYGS